MTTLGAIRWDAWYSMGAGDYARATASSLGPDRWHGRAPLHGTLGRNKVTWEPTQETMDAEITAAHGKINYWAFLQYDPASALTIGWNLFQSSSIKSQINWCWMDQPAYMGTNLAYTAKMDLIVTQMLQSNYQKVLTNRPLFYIYYTASHIPVYWGNDANFKTALDYLRTQAQAAGLGNPYIVLMQSPPTTAEATRVTLGCDACSQYVPAIPAGFDLTYAAFDTATRAFWDTQKAASSHIVPIASLGWNQVPRIERPTPGLTNKPYFATRAAIALPTNSEVTAHIAAAYAYVTANAAACEASTILCYAWNEHDEGGWMAPTHGDPTGTKLAAVNAGRS